MKYKITLSLFLMFPFLGSCQPEPQSLHQEYQIFPEDIEPLTAGLPESMGLKIKENPQEFLEDLLPLFDLPWEYLVLVDKQHSLGEDFIPEDLVALTEYSHLTLSRRDLSLRKPVFPDLFRMIEDARKEGLTLMISSTYRSYQYQKGLFTRNVERYGLEQASRESAQAGTSQHQLGMTLDFGSITEAYAETPPGKWLLQNAWKYGFSLSYPNGFEDLTGYRYENWHYRYITPQGTLVQQKWFGNIQQYFLMFWDEHQALLREKRVKE